MRLTCWFTDTIQDLEWRALYKFAESLHVNRGGYERPSYYLNHRTGVINYNGLFDRYEQLDMLLPSWVPFLIDLEHNSWITEEDGPITPLEWFKARRDVAKFVRTTWPRRKVGNWNMPRDDVELLERLGCAWTYGCKSIYMKDKWDLGRWRNIVTQRYQQALPWQMKMAVYVSPAVWGSGTTRRERLRNTVKQTAPQWMASIEMLEILQPDHVIFWGAKPNDLFSPAVMKGYLATLVENFPCEATA